MSLDLDCSGVLRRNPLHDHGTSVRLGMPHLIDTGLSMKWVLRECCHRQWWHIAQHVGRSPARLEDLTGTRMMASVVDVAVRGPLSAFQEDDLLHFEPSVLASPATGWRGSWNIRTAGGVTAQVELVTAFAKRTARSNRSLTAADLPPALRADRAAPTSYRARCLRARGKSVRAAASTDASAPLCSVEVCAPYHYNGVGLVYFANFVDFFDRVEQCAIPDPMRRLELKSRSIHYFANVDEGDWIDLECDDSRCVLAANPELTTIALARRRSDRVIIAACISTRSTRT